jgi:hypothetical protein
MQIGFPFWPITVLLLCQMALTPLLHGQASKPAAKTPAAAPSTSASAEPAIRRLILKDGSYQVVEKLEVHSDRVRYLSAERFEWEEVPASLVDWPATEKYAREGGTHEISPEAKALDAEEQAELKQEEARTPLVAPGLRLPDTGGIFLLDVYQREAQLNELAQNGGEVKRHTGSNILRATVNPLASQRRTIELPGQHARIQAHVGNPFFYLKVEPEADAKGRPLAQGDCQDRFRLIRLEAVPKKDLRVVGNVKVAIYGKVSQEEKFLPSKCEALPGQTEAESWWKLTPVDSLDPGEYAVVELLQDNEMNLYVWDFGVNPKAPPNAGAWFGGKP